MSSKDTFWGQASRLPVRYQSPKEEELHLQVTVAWSIIILSGYDSPLRWLCSRKGEVLSARLFLASKSKAKGKPHFPWGMRPRWNLMHEATRQPSHLYSMSLMLFHTQVKASQIFKTSPCQPQQMTCSSWGELMWTYIWGVFVLYSGLGRVLELGFSHIQVVSRVVSEALSHATQKFFSFFWYSLPFLGTCGTVWERPWTDASVSWFNTQAL